MTTAVIDAAPAADCTHHWLIASPNGKVSVGRCLRCRDTREFLNSLEEEKRLNNNDLYARNYGKSRSSDSRIDDAESALRDMFRPRLSGAG